MTTFKLKAHNSITKYTKTVEVEAQDYDHAAAIASELWYNEPAVTVMLVWDGGRRRADVCDGWHPALWKLIQAVKSKR